MLASFLFMNSYGSWDKKKLMFTPLGPGQPPFSGEDRGGAGGVSTRSCSGPLECLECL